jgi:hypothetical protein
MKWVKDVVYWLSIYLCVAMIGAILSDYLKGALNGLTN